MTASKDREETWIRCFREVCGVSGLVDVHPRKVKGRKGDLSKRGRFVKKNKNEDENRGYIEARDLSQHPGISPGVKDESREPTGS